MGEVTNILERGAVQTPPSLRGKKKPVVMVSPSCVKCGRNSNARFMAHANGVSMYQCKCGNIIRREEA